MMQRSVIPVFYNIDASVVRHQTENYEQAFEKHQIDFVGEMEKVNKWRLALTEVAHIWGKHISGKRSEADIINEIVDRIVHELNPKTLDVAKYLVGLDSRVKELTTLLRSGTEGVTRIGIYGMGGVGKTTLAKAVYNQNYCNFDGSCC
ncbi:TMV resistance protein N-like [Apium graveolens]|uniref:TMV resistance protein N-like n=1 Tax=Apium graveolens TaxID=4045 RepID=UPI003D7B1E0E